MTLILAIATRSGHWLCTDNQVSAAWPRTTRPSQPSPLLRSKAIKLVGERGEAAGLAYTGLATVDGDLNGENLVDWLRRSLAGKPRTVLETLDLIYELSNDHLRPVLQRLHIEQHGYLALGFDAGRAWLTEIVYYNPGGERGSSAFRIDHVDVGPAGRPFKLGVGADSVSPPDWQRMEHIARRPRRSFNYDRVLAEINRRTAETRMSNQDVSASSHTMWMDPKGPISYNAFNVVEGQPWIESVPTLIAGPFGTIDWTDLQRMLDVSVAGKISPAEFEKQVRAVWDRGIGPPPATWVASIHTQGSELIIRDTD